MQFAHAYHQLGPDSCGPAVAGVARVRDRAVARLRHHQLDLALSEGASPEESTALALRARRLTSLRERRALAATYRRIILEPREGSPVSTAREELESLADALARPGPVATQGAAQALLLLTDGTGPLHNLRADASLPAAAGRAADNLRLR
jgi:hypothetical protein